MENTNILVPPRRSFTNKRERMCVKEREKENIGKMSFEILTFESLIYSVAGNRNGCER